MITKRLQTKLQLLAAGLFKYVCPFCYLSNALPVIKRILKVRNKSITLVRWIWLKIVSCCFDVVNANFKVTDIVVLLFNVSSTYCDAGFIMFSSTIFLGIIHLVRTQNFQKSNIFTPPPPDTQMYVFVSGGKNLSFWENFANVSNGWSLIQNCKPAPLILKDCQPIFLRKEIEDFESNCMFCATLEPF